MPAMRLLSHWRWLCLLLLALAPLLVPGRSIYGQATPPTPQLARGVGVWSLLARPAAPSIRATTAVTGTEAVFLPMITAPPGVLIQFGTGVDNAGSLTGAGTSFSYGITHLYYQYTVNGATNLPYRTEWYVDGVRQPQLDDSGTVLLDSATFTNYVCSLDLGSCGAALPKGVYQVDFFLDETRYQQASATIQ